MAAARSGSLRSSRSIPSSERSSMTPRRSMPSATRRPSWSSASDRASARHAVDAGGDRDPRRSPGPEHLCHGLLQPLPLARVRSEDRRRSTPRQVTASGTRIPVLTPSSLRPGRRSSWSMRRAMVSRSASSMPGCSGVGSASGPGQDRSHVGSSRPAPGRSAWQVVAAAPRPGLQPVWRRAARRSPPGARRRRGRAARVRSPGSPHRPPATTSRSSRTSHRPSST